MQDKIIKGKRVIEDGESKMEFRRYVIETDSGRERLWEEFWKHEVSKDGEIDLLEVKKHLCDYFHLLEYSQAINSFISNGKMTKAFYPLPVMINEVGRSIKEIAGEMTRKELIKHSILFKTNDESKNL